MNLNKRTDLSKLITDTAKTHGKEDNRIYTQTILIASEIKDLQDTLDAAISILTEEQLIKLTKMLVEKGIQEE